ncbi:MAG: PIN domain-containing protein [Candidatus Micrarchaeota archaeon]
MQLVVDANILFAALIKDSKTIELLFSDFAMFFAPEFILEEFQKHRDEILQKTSRSPEEFDSVFEILKEVIIVVPKEDYEGMLPAADKIAPDPKDAPYLALALKLNIPIWSNDKRLKTQNEVNVYSTKELLG